MPKKVDHDRQREMFAKAAYRVLARKGLDDTRLRDVADEAGFSIGALAHYMRDKDALLLGAMRYISDKIINQYVREGAYHDIEVFRHMLLASLPLTAQRKAFWRATFNFWERAQQNKEVQAVLYDGYARWYDHLVSFLRMLKEDGKIPQDIDLRQTALGAIALVDGISVRMLATGLDATPQKSRILVDAWLKATLGYDRKMSKAPKQRPSAAKKRRK